MTWVGIGNVTGIFWRASPDATPRHERLLLRGGVVGYRLPNPRPVTHTILVGDTIVLGTDGLRSGFIEALVDDASPQKIADTIHRKYRRGTDDSLILVARFTS
jgi:hypothetical protein